MILAFPPHEWGLRGYRALWANEAFRKGFGVSVTLAATVTAISLGAGTAAAFAIVRSRFPGRDALLALFTAPLLLPGITAAAALSFLASFDEVVISLFLFGRA